VFLASALLRVARAVPIQAPASVSVVSSVAVLGSNTGVSVFRAFSTLTVFVESVEMLQPAVSLTWARPPRALLRVQQLFVRS